MTDLKKFIKHAYKVLDDKKAEDITVIDISNISTISDYFIIANGSSSLHVQSLVNSLSSELSKIGYEEKTVEGGRDSTWILMDYLDAIVHIFTREDRSFYNLERIWQDGKVISKKDILSWDE